MTTPLICCVFICTNPNQTSILGSGRNLQLPRAKKEINWSFLLNPVAPAGIVRPHRFEVWTRFAWGLYIWKTSMPELCHLKCSCHCKVSDGTRGLYIWKHSMWECTGSQRAFLESFPGGLMLAHVAGSVSTDLNVWERMANPCVSQADCHSATTASVVWLLALDFIFTLCVSPCPGILILDVVQTRSFLDWSHTGAFDFSRLCLYQHWSWGQGGTRWI